MKAYQAFLSGALAIPLVPLLGGISQAATIAVLDPFTNPQALSRPNQGTTTSDLNITSTLLGAVTRRIQLGVTQAGSGPATANVPVVASPLLPGFTLNTPTLVNARSTIQYRGTSSNLFAPVNFTLGGADRISVGVISSDIANAVVGVTVRDADGTNATLSQTLPTPISSPNHPVPVDFLFSDAAFVNIDFTKIRSFTLLLDPVREGDIAINFLELRTPPAPPVATPEPTTLLGLLTVGLLGSLRSSKQQKS